MPNVMFVAGLHLFLVPQGKFYQPGFRKQKYLCMVVANAAIFIFYHFHVVINVVIRLMERNTYM